MFWCCTGKSDKEASLVAVEAEPMDFFRPESGGRIFLSLPEPVKVVPSTGRAAPPLEPVNEPEPAKVEPEPVTEPGPAKIEPEPVLEPEPVKEPEAAKVEPEPLKAPEPSAAAPVTFLVEVEKKRLGVMPGGACVVLEEDHKVGLFCVVHGRRSQVKAGLQVEAVRPGLIQTYNQTAATGKMVMSGTQILSVNGITTPVDAMLKAIAEDTTLKLVCKSS